MVTAKVNSNTNLKQDRRKNCPETEVCQTVIKTGLRWKFIATITGLVLFITCWFSIIFYLTLKHSLGQEFEKKGIALSYSLAQNSQPYLKSQAYSEVERITRQMMTVPDVIYIQFLDPRGNSLVAVSTLPIPLPVLDKKQLQKRDPWQNKLSLPKIGEVYDFVVPIQAGAGILSTLRLGLSMKTIQAGIRSKGIFFLICAGGCILMGILLALFLSQIIVRPIQTLARVMKTVTMEEDEYDASGMPTGRRFRRVNDVDLDIHSQDEIEQLADEFRQMVRKLEKTYSQLEKFISDKIQIAQEKSILADDLKELNRRNEALVKERTREIVEKNLRLYEISEELQFQKDELINKNEQLEKISNMKSEFLATMSHELRTPLNSIIGFAEVLKEKMFGELNERQEKYLTNILSSGQHLLKLINNILDISKVEAGKMKLNLEAFSINLLIDEVQNIIRTLAYKKNIELKLELGQDIMLKADEAKIKQIFYNLLSNAIKFTDERGVVTVSTQWISPETVFDGGPGAERFVTESESILMSIRDTGIGIKPEDQEKIFREFEQSHQTRARKYEGTGLGLALTRKLVHLHGGKIWIKSELGKGTEVMVVLPLQAVEPPEEESASDKMSA